LIDPIKQKPSARLGLKIGHGITTCYQGQTGIILRSASWTAGYTQHMEMQRRNFHGTGIQGKEQLTHHSAFHSLSRNESNRGIPGQVSYSGKTLLFQNNKVFQDTPRITGQTDNFESETSPSPRSSPIAGRNQAHDSSPTAHPNR
jgi:hypothetical protein